MSKIHELLELGQSVWYDYIRRSFILSGELQALVDHGLRGVTSNPSIFHKAIAGSADYDEDIKGLLEEERSPQDIYEALVIQDITMAADILRPVYDETEGRDGLVSLEVNPLLAHDTPGTVSEARGLFERLGRPNVMIKVPATTAGILAIPELIGDGVNVNVTLLFSTGYYQAVADAYMDGLEILRGKGPSAKGGLPLERVASVASFFVSRVDSAVDRELERQGFADLQGRIAVANAKVAYHKFREIFRGPRWESLADKGARVQRLLWASTGTKNALYPDTLYVDQLIGPDTVNTMPPGTLRSFIDHGTVAATIDKDTDRAGKDLEMLARRGVDLNSITEGLLKEGVASFSASFHALMEGIQEKADRIKVGKRRYYFTLGGFQAQVGNGVKKMREDKVMFRIWAHDHTLWKDDPEEIANRLGWLYSPETMMEAIPAMGDFAGEIREQGYTRALLLGMGGSSLAPEMFRRIFGVAEGYLDLSVLDSTDPGAVLAADEKHDPGKTLYIVSTKSGGTIETLSFMKYFYNRVVKVLGKDEAGSHFVAITDPGSGLQSAAEGLGFRRIFLNDPNIGGRYSALSYFGLVPAALIGLDLEVFLDRAGTMACNSEGCNCPVGGDNSSALLGAAMGELAKRGLDKLTLVASPGISAFGDWAEQLIAESTGKEGKGVLPVQGEDLRDPEIYSRDRVFAYIKLDGDDTHDVNIEAFHRAGFPVFEFHLRDPYDIGGECFRWEMATAVAGSFLGINPFDQPNVESAKVLARQMIETYLKEGRLPESEPTTGTKDTLVYGDFPAGSPEEALEKFLSRADPGQDGFKGRSYVAIQAFLTPDEKTDSMLQDLRTSIQVTQRLATTVGYGPRFLHSTGQLHKGDAGRGLFIQITADTPVDVPIPDKPGSERSSVSFGVLKMAQALGDRRALLETGRRVIRFHLRDGGAGLKRLAGALGG